MKAKRYWRIGTPGRNTRVVSHWQMMQDRTCVAIGWAKLGDLSWVAEETREKLKAVFQTKYPTTPPAVGNCCGQIIRYVTEIAEGDIVLAAQGQTILSIGKIVGGYKYQSEFEFPHQRAVEWLQRCNWKMKEGLLATVREIKKPENILEIERRIQVS
jgi:5-methylcytosine-specific restriction protein B